MSPGPGRGLLFSLPSTSPPCPLHLPFPLPTFPLCPALYNLTASQNQHCHGSLVLHGHVPDWPASPVAAYQDPAKNWPAGAACGIRACSLPVRAGSCAVLDALPCNAREGLRWGRSGVC